ncbi:MAG: TRAP transporter large permease subunit [Alphaproteobacteria bacterium]|nr:TRAP transporter large permease subunit [Alphaproteobacteria bacterium]
MELFFLVVLVVIMATSLGSGFPVAFALPGAAVLTIALAGVSGYLFAGDAGAFFHTGDPWQWLSAGVTNLRSVYWVAERDTLIAIPLFIFMGIMLQRSKIAEDLLVTMAQLFGPVPGGLGISVVFVGALLAATTGIVGATVVAMGLISLPAMMRNNYSTPLATGTIAASGTLGQIIPPSIVLIILADQLASATDQAGNMRKVLFKQATGELSMPSIFDVGSTSAGEMFLGALVPGLLLVGIYMLFILVFAMIKPSAAPSVLYDGKFDSGFWKKVALTLVPPLALIFLVLGSIIAGVATVNQAGAIGAAGALIMAGYRLTEGTRSRYLPAILAISSIIVLGVVLSKFEMNIKLIRTPYDLLGIWLGVAAAFGLLVALIWSGFRVYRIEDTLHGVMLETAKTTALVFVILMGAAILTASFRAFGGEDLVRNFLNGLPGGFWSKFTVVMGVIFILGFFLDFIEISVVVVPIVAPILLADPSANITAVWLGVMIGLNIQTSFLTPPFGFALFYLRGVAPASVKTTQIYKGVIPFIGLQILALLIVGLTPSMVNYLPSRVSLLSQTSPPPRNPKLQYCLEQYVSGKLDENGGSILAAISTGQALDVSFLPPKLAGNLTKGFADATGAIDSLGAYFAAGKTVEAASGAYRPQLIRVRAIEKEIRLAKAEAKVLSRTLQRKNDQPDLAQVEIDKARLAELQTRIESLKTEIGPDWAGVYSTFRGLLTAQSSAEATYRRQADNAYGAATKMLDIIDSTDKFTSLGSELRAMRVAVESGESKAVEAALKDLGKKFNRVAGARAVASPLSKAKKAVRSKKANRTKALKQFDKAVAEYDAQLVWREAASVNLKQGLITYQAAIQGNLGIRMQKKLTREQALYLAACGSGHRDISLSF